MRYVVIIPAYNEEKFISHTLNSIINQSCLPDELVVVNDNSTDNTSQVAEGYMKEYPWIKIINNNKIEERASGGKVVRAFNLGLGSITIEYDLIAKIDADLILPNDYFEKIIEMFKHSQKLGIAGGTIVTKKNEKWVYENFSDKDHVKGAFKCYRNECFMQIGGLKESIGWDSVDELLAKYYGWDTLVNQDLVIKHLRPLGTETGYVKIRIKIGHGFYRLRYGLFITCISALKTAFRNKPYLISGLATIYGFLLSWLKQDNYIVTKEQGIFIRNYRYQRMKEKIVKLNKFS